LLAPAASVNEVKERLIPIKSMAVEMLKEVQRIILDLRPSILDDLGLVHAIDWYAESRLKPHGIKVGLEIVGTELRLPSELETAVFRMAQEAISNISKHAQAEHVNISLDFSNSAVVLDIEDDGRGFEPEMALEGGRVSKSFGLLGLRERAALFGGTMKINARPGQGTRITVEISWERLRSNGQNGYNGQEDTRFIGGRSRHFEGRPEGIAPPV
jgi:signal transduction histidine kinase